MNAALHGYNASGGTVDIIVEEMNEFVNITVRDYGMGITEDNLKHVFEPFFTTTRGTGGGTGLGLNITYNSIKQSLKGSITVESKVDKGTKFVVTLPKNVEA